MKSALHPTSLQRPAILAASLVLGALITSATDQNWPAWRGPLATGVAPQANPPTTWSETNHVKWKVKLPGQGTASPIIWDNQVFIAAAIPTGRKADAPAETNAPPANPDRPGGRPRASAPKEEFQFVLLSLDRKTGATLWQKVVREELPHEGHHPDHGFASYSPTTDGRHVFAYFGSRGLHCLDLQGNLKWSKDLGQLRTKNSFGEGGAPALHGNTVVIQRDHEGDDFIAAFDAESGRELWRQPRQEDTTWSTPLVIVHGGQTQVVASATGKIRSYDLATGKPLWECAGMTANVVPSPVADANRVYVTSGFRGSALLAIQLGRTGDLTGTDAIAWSLQKGTPYVPSALLDGGRLYFCEGNNPILTCVETTTGRVLIERERFEALQGVYASLVGAAGRVYLAGRNGATVVLKQADTVEVLATNRLEEKFDASPAVAGRQLFLRGREFLYCLSEE